MANSEQQSTTNGETVFSLCTFCNNSTNGFEKRLFATEQPKGPFFPILAELQESKTKLDLLGRAIVCVACFHHLLRQWSSFERRGIPVRKREYNIIADDRVSNYQVRREEEIRREAENKIKEIQVREERIRQEAEQRFEQYRERQEEIRREAEKRLLEEQQRAAQLKKEIESKLKAEQQREEELRRQAEERIQEEKEKRDYIRQEAERLLREEKLLEADRTKQDTQPTRSELTTQVTQPEIITKYRTEVIIPAVESVRERSPSNNSSSQTESVEMAGVARGKEISARSKSRKMMVYDPETGCYRKKSENEDEEGVVSPTKTERVEYRFRPLSDEKRGKPSQEKDSSSKPDEASEDQGSTETVRTEQSIMINGKNKSRSEEDEENLKIAGDIMKAKFVEGRKKFEQEPTERKKSDPSRQRTTRATSEDSLEEKIREMEKRRERLLLRGPSMELEKKKEPADEKKEASPREEPESPRSSGDDTAKKQRSRSERNKRRLTAEKLSLNKPSLGEERASDPDQSGSAKVPKTETKEKPFTIQVDTTDKSDDVFVAQAVKPVEAGPVDLMSWEDDTTDGPTVPDTHAPREFRKRADSTEGETFPKPFKLVEIEAPITVTQKEKVEDAPVNILDLDDEDSGMASPVIESISTWDNKARFGSTAEEDRRRREREHEERKRRIEENQRRAAQELKAKKQSSSNAYGKPRNEEPEREMTIKEKRRSLVDMWESVSEPQTNVMSFEEDEDVPPKGVLVRDNRAMSFDPAEEDGEEEGMEVDEEEKFSSSRAVGVEKNEKLSEEEQRWENAGSFQPGRLQKTVFHSLSESAPEAEEPIAKPRKGPSRYDWMKEESSSDQEALVPTKLKLDWQGNQATDEKMPSESPDKPPSPQPIQMEIKTDSHDTPSSSEESDDSSGESESESESEEERKPRIDTDEHHKLTEDEKQWESAGHFQPKKLNIAMMTSFQQGSADDGSFKPAPKRTQESSREMPKAAPRASPRKEVPKPIEPQTEVIEVEEISPVHEVKTETEPTHMYEEESESDDDIPGWRKVEEQRRQQEREEIERAKLEEKQRMEREAMEEDEEDETDSSDDEFEAKVRTQEIRQINPNLLSQFMKEPEKEPEKVGKATRPKEQKIEVANVQMVESTPSSDSEEEEEEEVEESTERTVEDEYEDKVKSRQIGKLRLDNSPFLQAKGDGHRDAPGGSRVVLPEERFVQKVELTVVESAPSRDNGVETGYTNEPEINTQESSEDESEEDDDVPEWRKMEEKRRQQEQEEIERAKLEEQRRREREASESGEEDSDLVCDEFEAKVRTKEIRKINPNLLFQFMGEQGEKGKPSSAKTPEKEPIKIQQAPAEDTSEEEDTSSEDSDAEDIKQKVADGEDDEYEIKVKSGQVKKLVLDNSPFAQKTTKEEPQVIQRRPEAKTKNPEPIVQEELVQVVDDKVVESEPDLLFQEPEEDDVYEAKVKSKLVKRLSQDQFVFLRKQEEEKRRRAQEEERRRAEREEREWIRKEEERRRRLEAEARAQEEERIHREEEIRKKVEEERAQKEEERRRKVEEAERVRREEEERIRREEEEELLRMEEMRRQKQEAKKKFESGVFDVIPINHTEKDIYSVGRLDSNKLMQFQKSVSEEPKLKSKFRDKEKTVIDESKVPEPEAETVVMTSTDLIETSPYDERFDIGPSEDSEYEEKRKSVGKLDKDWYLKQQERQAEEQNRRARELEEQRLREERNEMLRIRQEASSKPRDNDEPSSETPDRSDFTQNRSKLSVDKLSRFEKDAKEESKKSRKKKDKSKKLKKRDEVQPVPLDNGESPSKEKKKSMSSEDGSVVILTRDDEDTVHRQMRLQREREESELLRLEEERRRLASEEDSYTDEAYSDKPKNVGKLSQQHFSKFQPEGPSAAKLKTQKQEPQKVQEVISFQSQEDVESAPVNIEQAEVGPAMTQEDTEYEQKISKGQRLDVDKFLSSRSQEATEREQRAKKLAEERARQEQEELAKLRAEEMERKKKKMQELSIEDNVEEDISVQQNSAPTKAFESGGPKDETIDKRISVGRLPDELRSTFEGGTSKPDGSDSRKKSSKKSKGSSSKSSRDSPSRSSRSSSSDLSYAPYDRDLNGSVSPREEETQERQSIDRSDPSKDTQLEDRPIESYSPEEKPVPKKLNTSMFAAFEKGDREPEVQLRRAKSEKRDRPKSIGNVDLLRWQDDANVPSSSATSKKEKNAREPRPKSIAY